LYEIITHEGIICQLKFLENNTEKKSFLVNLINEFARKFPYMRIFSNVYNST